jgi:Ran GTPase-activating protein (RanGAP) involved in mRNA processing and transport
VNKQCQRLWLNGNRITAIGASILASALHENNTLERLYLADNKIADRGIKYLSKVLSTNNNTLKILALQQNGITDLGVEFLCQMIQTNKTLISIWLDNNNISDKGVKLISNALQFHNSTLQFIDLSKNISITDVSLDYIIDIIKHNRSLTELSIYDCNLSRSAKDKLRKAAKLKKTFSISLNTWNE